MFNNKLTTFALIILSSVFGSSVQAAPNNASCSTAQSIQSTLSSGAKWSMCWQARAEEGVVLSNIRYQASGQVERKVLGEMSLSQIQRNYDDGSPTQYIVTDSGLGGDNLIALKENDCASGELKSVGRKNVLCQKTQSAGIIYKFATEQAVTGEVLSLTSVSQVGNHSYIQEWLFHENGTIQPKIGISGMLDKIGDDARYGSPIQADGTVGIGFVDNYFWRLDFDLGGDSGNDVVKQIANNLSVNRETRIKNVTAISTESSRSFSPEVKRTWVIQDSSETNGFSPISYELVLLNYAQQSSGQNDEPWLSKDVFFTAYNDCERFAVKNPTTNGCGADVSEFVSGDSLNSADVVAWNRLSYHHLPRDEDDNLIGTQWSQFKLLPRDWHTRNPL
jgi:primary-amine oxidase